MKNRIEPITPFIKYFLGLLNRGKFPCFNLTLSIIRMTVKFRIRINGTVIGKIVRNITIHIWGISENRIDKPLAFICWICGKRMTEVMSDKRHPQPRQLPSIFQKKTVSTALTSKICSFGFEGLFVFIRWSSHNLKDNPTINSHTTRL